MQIKITYLLTAPEPAGGQRKEEEERICTRQKMPKTQIWRLFVHRAAMLALQALYILAIAIPSVRLSHAGIVSKLLHVARYSSLHCLIAKCV